jgi:hypothetical protein
VNLDRAFTDDGAWPDPRHEIVFADKLASGLRQRFNDLKRAAADGDRDPTGTQFTPAGVDLQGSSLVNQLLRWWHFRTPGSGLSGFFGKERAARQAGAGAVTCQTLRIWAAASVQMSDLRAIRKYRDGRGGS